MSELKIKYIFRGPNQTLKKPEIINKTLCVYLKQGNAFLFARKNKSLFELFLNSRTDKEKIKLINILENPKFYEFIKEIPNINNYSKITERYKLENFNSTEIIETNFKKWITGGKLIQNIAISDVRNIIRNDILKNYFDILNKKYNIKEEPKKITLIKPKKRKAIKIKSKAK